MSRALLFKDISYSRFITAVFIIICLLLFRYDFSFSLSQTELKANDTIWGVLEHSVFHDRGLTSLSLYYLESSNPNFDFHTVLANKDNVGGDSISVQQNKLTITGPNGVPKLSNALLFPEKYLWAHALQVISYNFVVFSILLFIFVSIKSSGFKLTYPVLFDVILMPILLIITMPFLAWICFLLLLVLFSFMSRIGI